MKPPQDALFAEHHQRCAEAPEAAHDVQCQHRPEQVGDFSGDSLGKDSRVKKEKAQRHYDAEEEKHLVAQRQPHAHARQCQKVRQSRSLLPVSSMNTSSREGVAISRLTSSLFWASRCFTSETMACGGRRQCST